MKNLTLRTLFLAVGLFALLAPARAQDLGAVKARMEQRIGRIDALKAAGAVGENNRGLLEVRDGGGEAAAVVAEENGDRAMVYAAIAKQTGSTADAVGRARARQIAGGSAAGVWLQKEDGAWYKK